MRICPKCEEEKLLTEFYQHKKGKNKGYFSLCKQCRKERQRRYRELNPWSIALSGIVGRCKDKAQCYLKKGIKNFLTTKDLKALWFRDKAYLMKRPSIDRKNNDGHYTLENCRYIELSENSRLGALGRKSTPRQREASRQNLLNWHKNKRRF